jgi:DHA3 family macrolide efflux protein-like MFS transporter
MTTGNVAETSVRRWRWDVLTGGTAILQEDAYRRLWFGRLFSNTALNAVLYTLLVLAVGEGSGTSIKSALFVTAYLLPTATLGTISGVLVDRLPKNLLLGVLNFGRVWLMVILVMAEVDVWTVYAIALLIATTSQFAAPAEAAALPQLVSPAQLTMANSTNNLGGLVSQVVGFAVLPPLFLNTVGPKPLFVIAAALFGIGGAFFLMIRTLGSRRVDIDSTIDAVREVRKQFAHAWERLNRDVGAYMSVIVVVLASSASLVAVTLMPRFMQDVLDIPVRNAIFVFLPAALGILAGLRLVQWLERRLPKVSLVGAGFGLLTASLVGLMLVKPLAETLQGSNPFALFDPGPFGDTSARIVVTVLFSTVAAFSYSVVGVASRAVVNERMPLDIQGRVFAAQNVLSNLASILPILLAGLLAELFGVEVVLGLLIVILVGVAGWTAAQAAARSAR